MPKMDQAGFQKLEDQKRRDDASAEAKGPDRVAAEVEAIGLLSNCILYTLQWLHIYIYRSINLMLKMIAFGFFFTRVSELHQNMLSGPCAATSCLEALH